MAPPKYASIIDTLQQRIADGTYTPGAMLPSEATLLKEFAVARPTLVRALEYLRQQGWIESRQGKGRFILGRPAIGGVRVTGHGYAVLNSPEEATMKVLAAGRAPAARRPAAILGVEVGTPLVVRRRLAVLDGVGPAELHTIYVPADVATGADLDSLRPLPVGLQERLRRSSTVDLDHVSERISARMASAVEARLLRLAGRECLLAMLLVVRTRARRPVALVDVLLPASRRTLDQLLPLR